MGFPKLLKCIDAEDTGGSLEFGGHYVAVGLSEHEEYLLNSSGLSWMTERFEVLQEDYRAEHLLNHQEEYTGASVSYYKLTITERIDPETEPCEIECQEVIEALGMDFAEGNAFKAIWRKCAARKFGKAKKGYDNGLYDAEKVVFFGQRMVALAKASADKLE